MPFEAPVLSAKEMAEFTMRTTHQDKYRRANLKYIEEINGPDYAEQVRKLMNAIQKQRKEKK